MQVVPKYTSLSPTTYTTVSCGPHENKTIATAVLYMRTEYGHGYIGATPTNKEKNNACYNNCSTKGIYTLIYYHPSIDCSNILHSPNNNPLSN